MPTDLDHMQHMNNSRYNRECDFSRFYLLFMNGLFRAIYFNKFKVGLAGTTIRFRRSIEFLVTAILSSKVTPSSCYIIVVYCKHIVYEVLPPLSH